MEPGAPPAALSGCGRRLASLVALVALAAGCSATPAASAGTSTTPPTTSKPPTTTAPPTTSTSTSTSTTLPVTTTTTDPGLMPQTGVEPPLGASLQAASSHSSVPSSPVRTPQQCPCSSRDGLCADEDRRAGRPGQRLCRPARRLLRAGHRRLSRSSWAFGAALRPPRWTCSMLPPPTQPGYGPVRLRDLVGYWHLSGAPDRLSGGGQRREVLRHRLVHLVAGRLVRRAPGPEPPSVDVGARGRPAPAPDRGPPGGLTAGGC